MRFEWDEAKASRNLSKHGVSFNEASTVFGDTFSWTYPDSVHSSGEHRWITIGLSEEGKLLVIAHADSGSGSVRIISARPATKRERNFYEQG